MLQNAIFDLDGTLLDTTEGIVESVRYSATLLGYPDLPYETLLKFVGPPIQDSFKNHYGCTVEDAQKAADIFRDYYKNKALLKAIPYEGIFDVCRILREKGVKIAVATYKREDYAKMLLCHFGFDKFCTSMHGADNNNVLTKSDIVNMCIAEMGGNSDDTVMVGDTKQDALGAEKSNIKFIGVTYGFGFKNEEDVNLYPNIGTINQPLEIIRFF